MADVSSKQQTTALFLSTIVTRIRRHTELIKKLKNLMGNLCCAREHSVQFFVQFFYTVKLHSLTQSVWGPLGCMGPSTSLVPSSARTVYGICISTHRLFPSYIISGFRPEADENCALLSHYAAISGNSLPTFRDNLSDLYSRIKIGTIGCPLNVDRELPLLAAQ